VLGRKVKRQKVGRSRGSSFFLGILGTLGTLGALRALRILNYGGERYIDSEDKGV